MIQAAMPPKAEKGGKRKLSKNKKKDRHDYNVALLPKSSNFPIWGVAKKRFFFQGHCDYWDLDGWDVFVHKFKTVIQVSWFENKLFNQAYSHT